MRALLPTGSADTDGDTADGVDVHAWYADEWIERGGVRANFVASADGAVHASGTSAGLQTPGDNRVFGVLRDLADVVLVGAGTATAEGYGAVSLSERRRSVRGRYGLAVTLPVAVLSRSLRLDPAAGLFSAVQPGAQTVVLTCAVADPGRRRALEQVADVVDCGADTIEPSRARAALEERGYRRILFEGGPSVFADFARADAVDEVCLSLSPLLVGPGPGRITAGDVEWSGPRPLALAGLLEQDGALFLRYRVVGD